MNTESVMFKAREEHDAFIEVIGLHHDDACIASSWSLRDGDLPLFCGSYDVSEEPERRKQMQRDVTMLSLLTPGVEQPVLLHHNLARVRHPESGTVLHENAGVTTVMFVDEDGLPKSETWVTVFTGEGTKPFPFNEATNPMAIEFEILCEEIRATESEAAREQFRVAGERLLRTMVQRGHLMMQFMEAGDE